MVYQLKISLLETRPEIWRRVLVPGNISFYRLHRIIQVVMGWGDTHLFEFHSGEFGFSNAITIKEYMNGDLKYEAEMNGYKVEDARRKKVNTYFARNEEIYYTYDYGDFWEHKVERELMADVNLQVIECIGGQGACPPDDCGGIHGYYGMLKSLQDPNDPENEEWREWLGLAEDDTYDNAFGFELEIANKLLELNIKEKR